MKSYDTKARRLILSYMAEHPDEGFTPDQLTALLAAEYRPEEAPGRSTVYRQVLRLEEESLIRRFTVQGSRRACYQLSDCPAYTHLHLKCVGCGRLYHVSYLDSAHIAQRLLQNYQFTVDAVQSVFTGWCADCTGESDR